MAKKKKSYSIFVLFRSKAIRTAACSVRVFCVVRSLRLVPSERPRQVGFGVFATLEEAGTRGVFI